MKTSNLARLVQQFFTDHMLGELNASPHTVAGYRDTFRLLLRFATKHLGREPSHLSLEELDMALLRRFLDHLERERANCVRTRNARLCALHTFFRYVSLSEPAFSLQCQRVLAMPAKRYERGPVEFLTEEESAALIDAPNAATWIGRRDRVLLMLAVQTGLRNGEITSLKRQDVELDTGAHVRCLGKGRKKRCTPLRPDVAAAIKEWLLEQGGGPADPLFPSMRGGPLSADALQHLVARHTAAASARCPSLRGRTITPHTLRHTAAMNLLHRGVHLSVIALWLGHEAAETAQIYLHADMRMKEQALAHASPDGVTPPRYRPADSLLTFLESL